MLKDEKTIATILLSVACLYSGHAIADIETDKNSGGCIAYFTLTEKPQGRLAALKMADKPERANQFANAELNRLVKANEEGRLSKSLWENTILNGASACRKVGIRPSDYK